MTMETQPFAITLNVGSSLANETGACPAGENIQ